jgi:RNA-directed DNA polymerase
MNPESSQSVSTKQRQIANLAEQYREQGLKTLGHYLDQEWLKEAYGRLRRDSAPGVDGKSVAEYGEQLEANLERLIGLAKSGHYVAPAVKRVRIPKGDGKETRPIGIPTVEDKVLQRAVVMILEPIYEKEFYDFSYGFRVGKSAHQALQAIWNGVMREKTGWIVDVDIRAFFDTLDQKVLMEMLQKRVKDGVILKLVAKWLKAGVMEEGVLSHPEAGTPQGGVISPMLSNIYLHEVLDQWFVEAVKPRLKGRGFMVRYADDFVMGFESKEDAERVMKALPRRFERYGLKIHEKKSRMVRFGRPDAGSNGAGKGGGAKPAKGSEEAETFDFLGFTHYWGKSRQGRWIVKRKTARKRLSRALKAIGEWCRKNRHRPLREQHKDLSRKVRGHYAYYGVTCNGRSLKQFLTGTLQIWRKWLDRRDRASHAMPWKRFSSLLKDFLSLPQPRIVHSVYAAKP